VAQTVPVEALTIPLFFQMRDFGLLDTLGSLVLPPHRLLAALRDLAAYIDGASRARFLWQILFPLVLPGLMATSVFSFISAWNDFLFAKSFIIQRHFAVDAADGFAGLLQAGRAGLGRGSWPRRR
jgi:N,N'-diacetylchitobiose transport system permease protein